ncbi:MAG: hypothetical protein QM831_27945 [Kofleriaceae bacterium]
MVRGAPMMMLDLVWVGRDVPAAVDARFGVTSGIGQALVIDPHAGYTIDGLTVAAELPLVVASIRQPAGSYLDTSTHGNLVLSGAWRVFPMLAVGIAIAPPLAGDGAHSTEALVTANSLTGYARPDAFTDAFAIVPHATFTYTLDCWSFAAMARVPIVDGDLSALFAVQVGRRLTRGMTLSISSQVVVPHAHVFERVTLAIGEHVGLGITSDLADTIALGVDLAY